MVLILIVTLTVVISLYMNSNQFTTEKWNNNIYTREKMLENFLENYDLNSMNYDEVIMILGKNGLVEDSKLTYYVGKSIFGPILFHIEFDSSNNVIYFDKIID